jgi:hypothetical protein
MASGKQSPSSVLQHADRLLHLRRNFVTQPTKCRLRRKSLYRGLCGYTQRFSSMFNP